MSYHFLFSTLLVLTLSACGGGGGGVTNNSTNSDVKSSTKSTTSLTSSSTQSSLSPTSVTLAGSASEENASNYAISAQGINREFSFFRPKNSELAKLPLVIDFHGANGIVWPEFKTNDWVKIARREQFYLLKPQAIKDSYLSYSYWNVGWDVGRDDVEFVKQILEIVQSQVDIDSDRIYVTGMSSGGHMAYYVAQKLQDRIAAVAPIAGSIISDNLNQYTFNRPMPLCHIHGDADTIVNIRGGDWYASWASIRELWLANNKIGDPPLVTNLPDIDTLDSSTVTKFEYRGTSIASDIDDYLIVNGPHSIPGIEHPGNFDINAYEIIWEFFKKHKLSDPY